MNSLIPQDKSAYRIERGVAAPEKITARGYRISTYTVYKIDIADYSVEIWQGESANKNDKRYLWTLAYRGEEDLAYIGYGEYMPAENLATFAECVDDINSIITRVNGFPDYFEKSRYDWHFTTHVWGRQQVAALLFKNKLGLRLGLEVRIYSPFWDQYVLNGPMDYSRGGAHYRGEDYEKIEELRIECCGDNWYAPRDISALDDFIDALQSEVGLTLIP